MTFAPLGEEAVLAYFPAEAEVFAFAQSLGRANPPWLQDVVPAYASVGVFFDAEAISTANVILALRDLKIENIETSNSRLHSIPVCYEYQLDLNRVAELKQLTPDEVIRLHLQTVYSIYAIGFVPGFPYLGYLPEALAGVPRLNSPRIRLEPGSVGITGRQTGLYPSAVPGGWNILGRTPSTVVDVEEEFFPLKVGDRIQFERIDEAEFTRRLGERIPEPGN